MMQKNAVEIKEQILNFLRTRGPSLPVHLAKETGLNILFSSAFLSELYSEQKIKMSHLRIGNSPLYFVSGQEFMLEKFADNLRNKEREAFNLLRERNFLNDKDLDPAIRVAMNNIKDFAVPFQKKNEIVWRFFTAKESDLRSTKKEEKKKTVKRVAEIKKEEKSKDASETNQKLDIFEKGEIIKEAPEKKKSVKKTVKKKTLQNKKQEEKFLARIKEFLSNSSTEILGIEGLRKDELSLRVKNNDEEYLLMAFNKKKISEKEIIKAAKKSNELGLKYSVLSLGELPKKISDLINALENIKDIGKVE